MSTAAHVSNTPKPISALASVFHHVPTGITAFWCSVHLSLSNTLLPMISPQDSLTAFSLVSLPTAPLSLCSILGSADRLGFLKLSLDCVTLPLKNFQCLMFNPPILLSAIYLPAILTHVWNDDFYTY